MLDDMSACMQKVRLAYNSLRHRWLPCDTLYRSKGEFYRQDQDWCCNKGQNGMAMDRFMNSVDVLSLVLVQCPLE